MKPLRKGDRIRCRYCDEDIWEARRDCGEIISASDFAGINGLPAPESGKKIECPICWHPIIIRDRSQNEA